MLCFNVLLESCNCRVLFLFLSLPQFSRKTGSAAPTRWSEDEIEIALDGMLSKRLGYDISEIISTSCHVDSLHVHGVL